MCMGVCLQHWKDLGFTDVSFDPNGSLIVSNTQPACIRDNNGNDIFFDMARVAAAGPPNETLPFLSYLQQWDCN